MKEFTRFPTVFQNIQVPSGTNGFAIILTWLQP